ncbi:MAG: hypothetical protein GTN62_00820 [Gemmatimonadales bacterium]|nr:hypothetical protein [Gemmatimonadales bacterium]NIN48645.1 hypothetical protein [Gemmatimonadales bacterium]NIP06109.1 hypothetical protein [Gemmatimonadales bacterium]NIR01283.1 hypothetical protein [Gemmatimonadales bacterium]
MGALFIAIALAIIAYWFFHSPLCVACSEAVRESTRPGSADARLEERFEEAIERLTEEVGALRTEVMELAERVDFTERVLVEARDRKALPVNQAR